MQTDDRSSGLSDAQILHCGFTCSLIFNEKIEIGFIVNACTSVLSKFTLQCSKIILNRTKNIYFRTCHASCHLFQLHIQYYLDVII